ncbi:MAG: tetratricopeptide repeat protein [Bacteroidales bacterium]|nr:tetratricopeptide repeat protein [Bacteroidales bacterium]
MKNLSFFILILMLAFSACRNKTPEEYYNKGNEEAKQGNYEEALENFNKAIELKPEYTDAYINRAYYAKENLNDYKGAIEDYIIAINLNTDDNDAHAYSNMAFAKMKMKKYKEALDDIMFSLTLDSLNSYAYRNKALIFIALNNKHVACVDLQKAIELGYTEKYGNDVQELIDKNCKE